MINRHLTSLAMALQAVDARAPRLQSWGSAAAAVLLAGGRLLACGAGGGAAQAQHLTGVLTRSEDDRPGLAAFALPAMPAAAGASAGRAGGDLEHQVRALGRRGDILLCVCATGGDDLAASARAAAELGMTAWALTGPVPNEVASACSDAVAVPASAVSTAEEVHLAAIHIFCAAVVSAVRDAVRAQAPAVHSSVVHVPAARPVARPALRARTRMRPEPAG
jgi:D-sedoheptulose 7-phosphate isomerase